jgi:hypothetical protein
MIEDFSTWAIITVQPTSSQLLAHERRQHVGTGTAPDRCTDLASAFRRVYTRLLWSAGWTLARQLVSRHDRFDRDGDSSDRFERRGPILRQSRVRNEIPSFWPRR